MAMIKPKGALKARPGVAISNTAANMLTSLYGRSRSRVNAAVAAIEADIEDPAKVKKVAGYDDVFVARGHGMRILFTRKDGQSVVTSVAADG
ncbi:hypothetical protein [Methylobacterium sp. A54F]